MLMIAVAAKSRRLVKLDNEAHIDYPETEGVFCNGLFATPISACRKISQAPFPDFESLSYMAYRKVSKHI